MKKILFTLLSLSVLSSPVFADCQLGERCNYLENEINLNPPYLGTYKCTLDTGSYENVFVEIGLLTGNTVADPSPLILNNDNKSGTIKVSRRRPPSDREYLVNAFRVKQTSVTTCAQSLTNRCDVPVTIMCEQVGA